jgi:hypothetical protein
MLDIAFKYLPKILNSSILIATGLTTESDNGEDSASRGMDSKLTGNGAMRVKLFQFIVDFHFIKLPDSELSRRCGSKLIVELNKEYR